MEKKLQLLTKLYFPQMHAKIKKIVKQCKIWCENKYDRHPNNIALEMSHIQQYPGQYVHIDIYHTNNRVVPAIIDKFSKYAQARIVKSRATEDVNLPLQELLTSFGIPKL